MTEALLLIAAVLLLAFGGLMAAVDAARGRWKSYGEDGHDLTYWRQTGAGGWEKKED